MNKKTLIIITVALALGAVYVFKFTDFFKPKNIQLLFTHRSSKSFFGFNDDKKHHLTQIKVVKADEVSTNKYALALWHMVATDLNKGSEPVKEFVYGQKINGMKPAIPDTTPEPLTKNVTYRIYVEAGKIKGTHDFQIK